MPLNDRKLPAFVIGNLYRNSLVDADRRPANNNGKSGDINFLGGNSKHILFLVKNENVPFLSGPELEFLSGVLSACKLNMSDIAVVNLYKTDDADHKQVIDLLAAETIIISGIESSALRLPFKIPEFQVQPFKNRKYLFTPGLDVIQNDKELKRKLWESLKNIFSV